MVAVNIATVFWTILEKLQERGHAHDPKQCRKKMKSLKKKYTEATDSLWRSGVGIESEDDMEDHEIFIGFKWFDNLHTVMQARAVMSPPALLDTSEVKTSSLSSPGVEKEQVQPEGEQQWEDEELSDAATQPPLDSNQPGPSICEEAASGLSKKKKRKTTKVEKMENTMKQLYEKFSAQQEKALKEAKEMEARRIELEERQAQREERDTVFDVVAGNVQYQA